MSGWNPNMYRNGKARFGMRERDIEESRSLLLEMVTYEPTIQQCFKIIESTCLSQGIICKIDKAGTSERFQEHLDSMWVPFCKNAIRAFFTYGFVPWRTRRVSRGDHVPEVIPCGLFEWRTEIGPTMGGSREQGQRRPGKRARYGDNDTRMVVYRITPVVGNWKEEDVNIFEFHPPSLDVTTGSVLSATVPSPFSHILTDYRNLRQAQIRRSHADRWNTTAKVITTFDPKLRVEDNPTQYLMDFVHEDFYAPPAMGQAMFPPFEAHNVWQREKIIQNQFSSHPSTHYPDVYALPRDHLVATQQMLAPCEDLQWLWDKFRKDVSSVMGVPFEMVVGSHGGHETVKKTMASGRIFSTNMHEICRHLQLLLADVYEEIYGASSVAEFYMVPMPRLEVESVADFKVLFEIGALTPDMSMKLSRLLLGEEPGISKKQAGSGVSKVQGILQGDSKTHMGNKKEEDSAQNGDKAQK